MEEVRGTMLAAVFKGDGQLDLEQRPVPVIGSPDDVLVEVGAVGICGSDLHMLDVPPKHPAKPGVILGHEFAGRVVAVGEAVHDVEVGDHVGIDPNPPCGVCSMCRSGLPNACTTLYTNDYAPGFPMTPGVFWDGAYAQYCRVPARHVYPVDKSVPFWQVAALEPLACVVNCMGKVGFRPGESAVVLGAGPIGLFFVSMFKASGAAKIIVSEPSSRRAAAAAGCGADVILNPEQEDVLARVMDETAGAGANVVVEAVGWLTPLAIQCAGMAGRVVLFGIDTTYRPQIDPSLIITRELQIFGGFLTKYTMTSAIRLLEAGLLPVDEIVTHRLPLKRVHEGIALTRKGEGIKVMLIPNEL